MKNLLLILAIFLASCTTYSVGDVNGKWTHPTKPLELWIQDTLAIGYDFDMQLMLLYEVEYRNNILTFTCIEPYEGSTWKDKIIRITDSELEMELQNPGNRERNIYIRLTDELPDISIDYETNYLRYESYMIGKLDGR